MPFESPMDYQLKPLGKTCSQTGKPFDPGDVCYSAVVEKGNEWVRVDFSAGAWTGPPEGSLGYWKLTVPPRDQMRRHALDPDALLRHFEHCVLSYEVGALKPSAKIFEEAVARAGCEAGECFFTDDLAVNVEAARKHGMDAVQFLSTAQLEEDLRVRALLL